MKSRYAEKIHFPIYYINLDRSKDRRKLLEGEFKRYKIPFNRISAVDLKNIRSLQKGKAGDIAYENICEHKGNKRALACMLSHFKTIKNAYDMGYESVLVVEDDISLSTLRKWKTTLKEVAEGLPRRWSILQLSCIRSSIASKLLKKKELYTKKKRGIGNLQYYGTAAYLISRKGMTEILSRYYKNGKFVLNWFIPHADGVLYDLPGSYIYNRPLFNTKDNVFESLIDDGVNVYGFRSYWFVKEYFKKLK